ncbi:MAG TPA: PAS domain S-box protein [Bryobacteraceae bacterium]|nr:PAS domain S-box protein [Bryobacteraceae bacterium]
MTDTQIHKAYEQLLGPAAVPVFISFNARISFVNPLALRLLGYSGADLLIGRPALELLSPMGSEATSNVLRQSLVEGEPTGPVLAQLCRSDGSTFDVEAAAWNVPYENDQALVVSFVDVSARMRADQERLRSEKQLRLVTDRMPGLVSYIGTDLRYQFTNVRYQEWFARPNEQLVGKLLVDIIGEESFRRVRPYMDRALSGEPVTFDAFLPYRDGGGRDVHVNYVPDFDASGVVRGVVVLVEDISDFKRAEAALHASEERYRAFIQQSSEGIWRFELDRPIPVDIPVDEQLDRAYKYAYLAECNDAMARMYGYSSAGEIVGARLGDLMPREVNEGYLRRFLEGGFRLSGAQSEEFDRYGNLKFFQNSLVGIIEKGCLVRAWGTQQDVTERYRTEAALRSSEARYRFLAENMEQFVWVRDQDGTIEYANRHFVEYTGLTLAQLQGESIFNLVHPSDVDEIKRAPTLSSESQDQEFRLRRHDGEYYWLLGRRTPYETNDGNRRWLGTAIDIELRRRAEDELKRVNAELEQYAYAASHDLQEPLRMVSLYAQLLRRRCGQQLDPQASDYLTTIESGASRLNSLVRDLLIYSRLVSGSDRHARPVDMNDVLRTTLANMQALIADTGAQILADPLPVVSGHADALVRVLDNLLSNAIKYRKPGQTPRVRIAAASDGPISTISVADNGIGIPPEYQDRIWRVFRRLHGASVPGTGIGLAICKKTVEQHGGRIWVDSDGHSGSTFQFTVPLAQVAAAKGDG